jgi:hypothetical protein
MSMIFEKYVTGICGDFGLQNKNNNPAMDKCDMYHRK